MLNSYIERLDSETRDVINYLRSRPEIVDLQIEETPSATQSQINEWEIRNLCSMPVDLKAFYLNNNGLQITWKLYVDTDQTLSLGNIRINPLKDLTRVGTSLHRNMNEPSLFDLEDIQTLKDKNLAATKSMSNFSDSSLISLATEISNISLTSKPNENDVVAEIFKSNLTSDNNNHQNEDNNQGLFNESSSDNENDINEYDEVNDETTSFIPHFGETSNNFELDNCSGYGKVCLVYRNRKNDCIESVRGQNIHKENLTEIWFLDRSLQWHYLTNNFQNYYRLQIAHLGLPCWQSLFTEYGLPPFLHQWYSMLVPGRILVHDNSWQKLQFLGLFETNNNLKPKPGQMLKSGQTSSNGKIDFTRLFDDKLQKSKAQNKLPPTGGGQSNSKQGQQTVPSLKPKSRNSLSKK